MEDIILAISSEDLQRAKDITKEFDAQKTYDKFKCSTNYIGVLGEILLDRYFRSHSAQIEWIEFVKKGWNKPDFVAHNTTIDLKTSHTNSMWFQRPVHDIYIFAHITPMDTFMFIRGFMTKDGLLKAIEAGKAIPHSRGSTVDYELPSSNLLPLEWLPELFPPVQAPLNIQMSIAMPNKMVISTYAGEVPL